MVVYAVIFALTAVAALMWLVKPLREKVNWKLIQFKEKMIWNGILRTFTFGYLNYCVCWAINTRFKFMDPEVELEIFDWILNPLLFLFIFIYPIFSLHFVMKKKNEEL